MESFVSRIPIATALAERGVSIPNQLCQLCHNDPETVDHVFVKCEFAKGTREWIFKWCGIKTQDFSHIKEIIDFAAEWGNCPKKRDLFNSIVFCLFWNIWKARNNRVFKELKTSHTKVADDIISRSYLWCKHRSKLGCGNWAE
ncbi:uncharacterized protein LOC111917854 [Lactuca sativa]|uniref:uncharacterized protein LOC111917854 n=1 Tax=Lactuca sativa TaxID=4236 RepID=UPI000CD86337|nr:uncharacterized protein LOC111917854 [Lactuca sativa]